LFHRRSFADHRSFKIISSNTTGIIPDNATGGGARLASEDHVRAKKPLSEKLKLYWLKAG